MCDVAADCSNPESIGRGDNKSATIHEDWSRLKEWIHCFCVVNFDLNLGQALEVVYPAAHSTLLSEVEISNICYNAFPDSNSGVMGDTSFHFRMRCHNVASDIGHHRYYNSQCVSVLRADSSHYYGYVYFRQKRDANLPRGYFQKSFIIISRLPFFNLFSELLSQLAPKYFNEGNIVLEQACRRMQNWPPLLAGVNYNLALFDCNYQFQIPKASSRKTANSLMECVYNENEKAGSKILTKIIASVNELELFHSLSFFMDNLYTLWELVLTAEPIVVIGTSPADCSLMVQTLVALIAPLEYCSEARPYFTIHDSEFKEFTRECGKAPPSVILGVTNPFFVKLLKDWPHLLRLVDNQTSIQHQQFLYKNARNAASVTSFSSSSSSSSATQKTSAVNSNSGNSLFSVSDGSSPGLHTKYKSFLKKDKTLIKKVMLGLKTKRPYHVQTALIRRHLLELTQSFMIPLERYMASLMPLQKDISPFKAAPNAHSFKLDDFLATLELSGPQLTSALKGDWKGLYKRFFNSPNFRGWYDLRHKELQITLQDLQLQALSEANLENWARDKQEVEIIDMILKLKQKLNFYAANDCSSEAENTNCAGVGNEATREQIVSQINSMKELLPPDLKNVINL